MDLEKRKELWKKAFSKIPDCLSKAIYQTTLLCDDPDEKVREALLHSWLTGEKVPVPEISREYKEQYTHWKEEDKKLVDPKYRFALYFMFLGEVVINVLPELSEIYYKYAEDLISINLVNEDVYFQAIFFLHSFDDLRQEVNLLEESFKSNMYCLVKGLLNSLKDNQGSFRKTIASGGGKAKQNNSHYPEAREKLRQEWATGKYTSKSQCAEKNHQSLRISYLTAIKYLRNISK